MKHKKKIITILVVLVLIFGGAIFMFPRIMLYNEVRAITELGFPSETNCEYFNQFHVTYDIGQPVQIISYCGLSVEVPADWTMGYDGQNTTLTFLSPDHTQRVKLMYPSDLTEYCLVNEELLAEYSEDLPYEVSLKRLEKGCASLNVPLPDSAYASMKAALLLERDNYSLFNLNKTLAYYIVGIIKCLESEYAMNYIYETEDICATYHVAPMEDTNTYFVSADIFSAKDLNTAYQLAATVDSEDSLYALMNSVQVSPEN